MLLHHTKRQGPWAGLLVLAALAPATAEARPPTGSDFEIRYYIEETDEDGGQGRLMDANDDLPYFVNQARCQCGQKLRVRVTLKASPDEAYDQNAYTRTFIGANCSEGEQSVSNFRPCAKFEDQSPSFYRNNPEFPFEMVWLASGVDSRDAQNVESAVPVNPCNPGNGSGTGAWICVENGEAPGCLESSEFVINGNQNNNATGSTGQTADPTDPSGGSSGLAYDFQAPMQAVTGFRASPGDGAVEIHWDRAESGDINGFRVLCAEMDGSTVAGKGLTDRPAATDRSQGEVYFTADNLCPDAVVYQVDEEVVVDETDTDTDGRDTDGDTVTGTSGGIRDQFGNPWSFGGPTGTDGASTTGDQGSSGTGGMMSSTTTELGTSSTTAARGTSSTTAAETSSTTGESSLGSCADGSSDLGICTLNWDYVCSGHVSGGGTSARISGLQNGRDYLFTVVAYDRSGNPAVVSDILTAIPEETTDFWEQCEQQGKLCGTGGFCHCRAGATSGAAWLGGGLLLLGLARRRRHRRTAA